MEKRTIFHVDMDAFFASVEILKNPSLKGKPVIVGGDPDKRGVVSTCSYEARKFGVHSAMATGEAKRLCPHGIFISGEFSAYKKYSSQVMKILRNIIPIVQVVSIDEAYLDVTDLLSYDRTAMQIGRNLRKEVLDVTGLTCSVGIASNKLVAKVASSIAKPNGLYQIPHGFEKDFFTPLPIKKIPGIGKKTAQILVEEGIETVGDLQKYTLEELIEEFGTRGYPFYQASRGIDKRPVESERQQRKSISTETTFPIDIQCEKELLDTALNLTEKAWRSLKKHQMRTRTLQIKLRDSTFKTITRSTTLSSHTQNLPTLQKEIEILFTHSYQKNTPLRLIGVSLEKLTKGYWQPTFWNKDEK